jgi:hypothetical protein
MQARNSVMTIQAEVRDMRAALKCAFPAAKFSARLIDNSIQFQWTGDCPTEQQVKDTLLETGRAQLDRDYGWQQLKTREGYFLSFYTRRPAPAYEVTARRAKSLITKALKKQFPETRFTLQTRYGSTTSPILFIEWLNGPQEDEVSTLVQPLSNGVRIAVTRNEPCDICGARTIACLRGKTCEDEPTDGLLVCLDCQFFGRWHRFKQTHADGLRHHGAE